MTTSQQRLVLVGSPTEATAVERWTAVLRWAAHHGWEITSRVGGGPIRYAIATEEVLDGLCSPTEAAVLHAVHTARIRCVSVYEAPTLLAGVSAAPRPAAARPGEGSRADRAPHSRWVLRGP